MGAPYNLTNVTSGDNIPELLINVNNQMADGFLGIFFLIAIFVIMLVAMRRSDPASAFASSSFITTLMAVFLVPMGLITTFYLIISIVMTIIGISVLLIRKN